MTTEPEYDPDTCWTAKELREFGFDVPETIPDCGWIPKTSFFGTGSKSCGFMLTMTYRTSEPFRWIECTIRAEKKV